MLFGIHRRRRAASKTLGEGIILLVVLGAFAVVMYSHVTGVNYCTGADAYLSSGTSDLASLPVNVTSSSSTGQELSNATFWHLAIATAANNASTIVQSTIASLISSDQHWRNWTEENLPVAPPWFSTSALSYVQTELAFVGQNATALAGNANAIQGMIKQIIVNDTAGGLTALDSLSFNGVTGLETFFDTRSGSQAICATFSGQLAQLYMLSFDPHVPIDQRAEYLGQLLAIASVMAALQGTTHFSDHFQAALDKAGLGDAWPSVKPYLSSLSTRVSAKASMLAFTVVEKVAQRFPQNSAWTTGLTIDRIQSMADVMKEKGATSPQIESEISNLVQAAGDARGPDDVAFDADTISIDHYGGIEVKVGSQGQMYLYSAQGTMQIMEAQWLQDNVPGFKASVPCQLKVYYLQDNEILYHSYEGGNTWIATVPSDFGKPGDRLTIDVRLLTQEDFVKSVPPFQLTNDAHFSWLPTAARVEGFSLNGDALTFEVAQEPSVEGITAFSVQAKAGTFGFVPGLRTYLQFDITDYFGQTRTMRVYFDGYSTPTLGMFNGAKFPKASLIAFDGVRLRIAYGSPTVSVATLYLRDPSVLYRLGVLTSGGLWASYPGTSQISTISQVEILRQTENYILSSAQAYPVGRVGAEIAYSVATGKLGIQDVVLQDPALGGPDLFSKDGKVVFEARMLSSTTGATPDQLRAEVGPQLDQMISRLRSDFAKVTTADTGYAIISYMDGQGNVQTIVAEVPKP